MVNILYSLPLELQHKINWMNIHSEIKTLVSQRQSQFLNTRSKVITTYVHDDDGHDWPTWLELEYFLDYIEHIKLKDSLEYEKYVDEKNYWEPQWA